MPFLISFMRVFPSGVLLSYVERPSGIGALLERFEADAAHGIEEAFAAFAFFEIGVDHALNRIDDLMLAEAGTQDFADGGVFRAGAAQLQLVEFDAFLVDAENADVSGVMMAAGIDAAGNLDLEFADVALVFEIGEALRKALRNGDRTRIGEIAIIEAGTRDDVGDEPRIGGREPELCKPRINRGQILLAHMRQNEIL